MVTLLNLKTFMYNYFYTTVEDEELFLDYMKRTCYRNGQVLICTEEESSKTSPTTYDYGVLHIDMEHDVNYSQGILEGLAEVMTQNEGEVWLID